MSSIRQELSAILMNYSDSIDDMVYINILNDLAKIPNHKDPKKALEIQKELDKVNRMSLIKDNEIFCYQQKLEDLTRTYNTIKYNMLKKNELIIKQETQLHCLQKQLEAAKQKIIYLDMGIKQT